MKKNKWKKKLYLPLFGCTKSFGILHLISFIILYFFWFLILSTHLWPSTTEYLHTSSHRSGNVSSREAFLHVWIIITSCCIPETRVVEKSCWTLYEVWPCLTCKNTRISQDKEKKSWQDKTNTSVLLSR